MSRSNDKTMRQDGAKVWVTLTLPELMAAVTAGAIRDYESQIKNLKPAHGLDQSERGALIYNIEGAIGEICVAKVLNKYWGANVNTFKGADIGDKIQVRCRSKHTYDLLVRNDDNPEYYYFHVTGIYPDMCVRGWMKGSDAKNPKYLKEYGNRPPAYFIPESDLNPIEVRT